jgi:amino acid transporter
MAKDHTKPQGRFGSFAGVFTPNILTILGIILFLRTGWVVGQAGLAGALIIIFVSNLISFFTGLSLSSIATSMNVRTGGTYYMISRTLGFEIGGAIGVPFYLSQAISVAFYIIGFTEAFTLVFPSFNPTAVSLGLVFLFGFLAFIGADFAIRIQIGVLVALTLAIVSLFAGGWEDFVAPTYFAATGTTKSFWTVFAVFFPAVTGIMVGVSMSGDLRDPGRAIPRGTLSSILVSFAVYVGAAVWLGTHASPAELVSDNLIMQKIARWPLLILGGVWVATLSSALGSAVAAPRTLQALAYDRVVPKVLSTQMGSRTEPRLAVLVTTAIAVTIILMGNLNFVAPIITMFFLNTYGMINITAGIERLVDNPNFRPQFRVPWLISFVGGLGCYAAMFLINAPATLLALLISYGIYFTLKRRSFRQNWGDVRRGFWFTIVRFGLTCLQSFPPSSKNWRPNIVAFTGTAGTSQSRDQLMTLAAWLSSGRGIVTLYHLIEGDVAELGGRGLRQTSCNSMRNYLDAQGVTAFADCIIVNSLYAGIKDTMQIHGVSGIKANAALIGWSRKPEVELTQIELLQKLTAMGMSVLFLDYNEAKAFGQRMQIDVWWRGQDENAELMLMLAHIVSRSAAWQDATIRVVRVLEKEEARQGVEAHIAQLLQTARVEAEPVIMIESDLEHSFQAVFKRATCHSDLVFLGLPSFEGGAFADRSRFLRDLLRQAPSTVLVRSAEVKNILDTEAHGPP